MLLKRCIFTVFALSCVLPSIALGQESDIDSREVMKAFARRAEDQRVEMTVIHLNDLTTDMLFDAPAKYSLRAQARGATMFFVQGAAKRNVTLDFEFEVFTNRALPARAVNIANFERGTELSEGDTFTGIVALEELLNLRTGFTLRIDDWRLDYQFTPDQLSMLDTAAGG